MICIFTHVRRCLGVVVCGSCFFVVAAGAEPLEIQPSEPRAQIRTEILRWTKIGSELDDVVKFVNQSFKPIKDTPAPKVRNHPASGPTAKGSDKKGVQSIRLVLGHYQASPGLLLLQVPIVVKTTTVVQWAFDKEGKLTEVFVDKDAEPGDMKSPEDGCGLND